MMLPWSRMETTSELALRRPVCGAAPVMLSNIRETSLRPVPDREGRPPRALAVLLVRAQLKGGGAYTPRCELSTRGASVRSAARRRVHLHPKCVEHMVARANRHALSPIGWASRLARRRKRRAV